MTELLHTLELKSPLGTLTLEAAGSALRAIRWQDERTGERSDPSEPRATVGRGEHAALDRVADQLEAYFAGTRRSFDLELSAVGTPFQRAVWARMARIPYGQTATYGEIATTLGDPRRARAVGAAGGRNPLPIVVPCHRVIGADGRLTGFAAGLRAKHWLLEHESGEPTLPFG